MKTRNTISFILFLSLVTIAAVLHAHNRGEKKASKYFFIEPIMVQDKPLAARLKNQIHITQLKAIISE